MFAVFGCVKRTVEIVGSGDASLEGADVDT